MLETSGLLMDHLPFSFLKNPLIAITLSLLLLISFCSCYSYFSSTILTLLVLVLPTSFPFIFTKIKQLYKAGMMKQPQELEVDLKTHPEDEVAGEKNTTLVEEVEDVPQMNELACSSPHPPLPCKGLKEPEMDRPLMQRNKSLSEEVGRIPLRCSDSSASDDEPPPENASRLSGFSEGSISDDDSLIEIALPDGHCLDPEEPNQLFGQNFEQAFLQEFFPESAFKQHGPMETLSEINEEDNLIEIDIAVGSIKCSRVGIKARVCYMG